MKAIALSDFIVTKTVTTNSAVTSTVVPTSITTNGAVATLAVPTISALVTSQAVVYNVTYKTVTTAAVAYTIAAIPAITVSSVATTNLKEITVMFNEKVDEITAENLSNYTLDSYTWTTANATANLNDAAVLQADGKTVIITLKNGSELVQQTAHALAVAGVKSAASGVANISQSVNFTALDLAVPTATSVTVTGPTSLRVTFSEPVKPAALGTFALDSNMYSVTVVGVGADNRTVDLTVGTTLPAGAHSLVVSGTQDYTGVFTVPSTTLAFNYAADATLPTVTATTVTQNSVVLTFSKPISSASQGFVSVYHTYNNVAGYMASSKTWSSNGTTLTVAFASNYLPLGAATVYVNTGADTTNIAKDQWGNAFVSATLTVAVAADVTAPAVSTVAYVDATHIDVTFSKLVTGVVPSVFTLKNASATSTLTVLTAVNTTGNTYRLTTSAMNGDTYVLSIAGAIIADTAVVPNKVAAYTNTFVVGDTTNPDVTKVAAAYYAMTDSLTKIKVTFTKNMATTGTGSVLSASNYQFDNAPLVSGTTLAIADGGKSVIITLPAAPAGGIATKALTIGRVADTAGNFTTAFATTVASITAGDVVTTNFVNPKTISTTTVTVEINTPIQAINYSLFRVNGIAVTSATYINKLLSDGVTNGALITLTVATPWASDATPAIRLNAASALTTSFGTVNSAAFNLATATVDGTTPALVSTVVTDATHVTLTYSEALKATTVGLYTYTVAGNTVIAVDNTNIATGVTVLTLGTALVGTTPTVSVTQAVELQDLAGNKLAATATAVASGSDTISPIATLAATTNTTNNATTLVATYSEALYNGAVAIANGADVKALFTYDGTAGNYTSATYNATAKTVTFVFTAAEDTKELTAANTVKDIYGNVVNATSDVFTYTTAGTLFTAN